MPDIPPLVPNSRRRKGSTSERGYGYDHQEQRKRLIGLYPLCQRCGQDWSRHLHHRDRNPLNRADANVECLCVACHKREHNR